MERSIQGVYMRGKQICYYKPTDRKTGDLWKGHYVHPKTKQITFYSIYGGKLSGILTQSFCRELFYYSLSVMKDSLRKYQNVQFIGQFHDEIVVEWTPPQDARDASLAAVHDIMYAAMSATPPGLGQFPLTCEIGIDHRYIK
jgi:hypothetical protein